jgi:hypothetical protein
MSMTVTCATCEIPRPESLAGQTERPPCPECGAVAISMTVHVSDAIAVADGAVDYILRTDNPDGAIGRGPPPAGGWGVQ